MNNLVLPDPPEEQHFLADLVGVSARKRVPVSDVRDDGDQLGRKVEVVGENGFERIGVRDPGIGPPVSEMGPPLRRLRRLDVADVVYRIVHGSHDRVSLQGR